MLTTGTDCKVRPAVMAALIGVAAISAGQWRAGAKRVWSYGVYCVGYRLLSVQLTCGSWALNALTLLAKHA